jgi:hypothetical protein
MCPLPQAQLLVIKSTLGILISYLFVEQLVLSVARYSLSLFSLYRAFSEEELTGKFCATSWDSLADGQLRALLHWLIRPEHGG